MVDKKYRGQIIVDIAGFIVLFLILIIYYSYTKPYEKKYKNKI